MVETKSISCGLELKSITDNVIGGYIATTHLDSGFPSDNGTVIRDRVSKEVLDQWAHELNNGVPRANKVSIRHDRSDPVVAGAAVKGTAKVDQLADGEYGLYVDSVLDTTHENWDATKHRIDIGTYDSFSIEFLAGDGSFQTYERDGYTERVLMPGTELHGYALASRPMNEHAVRIKETVEVNAKMEPDKKETPEPVAAAVEQKEVPAVATETKTKDTEAFKVDEKAYAEFQKFKEMQAKEAKESELKAMKDSLLKELKDNLDQVKVQNKVAFNKLDVESKEMSDYKETVEMKGEMKGDGRVLYKKSVSRMFQEAGVVAEKMGLIHTDMKTARTEWKNFTTNGTMLECKGLGITTNQGSTYYISAPELADVFDPVIYSALNQQTLTWNLLTKEDKSSKGNNLVQFKLELVANSTAAFYTGNAVTTGNTTLGSYATKFKKCAVGVEVDGDMIAAARGGPVGDVFAAEVQRSTNALMAVINTALFAEVGLETAAAVIGFEYITDQAGNTTLYGYTRSQANGLASSTTTDNYINGSSADLSLANLRGAKRKAVEEGAQLSNLVFITSPIQGDKLRGIYDSAQRLMPTSSRFGFEGRPEFDGIPVFEDKDCSDDDVFLVDLESHKVAIWVPPTLEMLGKDADSEKGFIKTYFCTYNTAPRRMVQIYGNATS